MKDFSKKFVFFFCLLFNCAFLPSANRIKYLSNECRFESVSDYFLMIKNEKRFNDYQAIMCDVDDDSYEFKFIEPTTEEQNNTIRKCDISISNFNFNRIIFRWTSLSSNRLNILDKRFNFTNLLRYVSYSKCKWIISIWGVKGFDLNMFEKMFWSDKFYGRFIEKFIELSNFRLDFYHGNTKLSSCQDFVDYNITRFRSIFQITSNWYIGLNNLESIYDFCPLVFSNSNIQNFVLNSLVDTFYRKRVFTFSNETYPHLMSNIKIFGLSNVLNINLDFNLLNPSVFKYTTTLSIDKGSLNSINKEIFLVLKYLSRFLINSRIFRKINQKQGIEWIKKMNYDVNVNLSSNSTEIKKAPFEIVLTSSSLEIVPDEDFCIYVDFPFNQFVIIYSFANEKKNYVYSCIKLWLFQYYEFYYKYFISKNDITYMWFRKTNNSEDYKTRSICNFEERIRLCNKSNYQVKDIWDESDFFILNYKIQIVFKISLYPVSFIGLVTNLIVVIVIIHKHNNDLFKEFKQYSYLWLNSIFCTMILVIELFSWMNQCFYPFEVFCPEIRKLVGIQYFKIIFHECLVTVFRFMCNFTYVAFALNRISLIGREHGKLVTFMSELSIKRYIGVTLLISISFSWIKYFKYEINYFYTESNFPMSNEMDIQLSSSGLLFYNFFFIFNSISDLVNYLLFYIICVVIDICMVVKLRRVLNEKTKKSESLNQKQSKNKKAENEAAVNKAIKMVVVNSLIGIFFKLPVLFIPLLNMHAQFTFKDLGKNFSFYLFYSMFMDSGLFILIQDVSNFLFNFSLSIQMFIYIHFDKKFRTGFDRLKDKMFLRIKNLFNSNS